MRTVRTNLRAVGDRVAKVTSEATERVSDAAETAGERLNQAAAGAGRTAVGVGVGLLTLPELVREGARRSVGAVETAGSRAVVSAIRAGTRVLSAAADLVSELTPRRRMNRSALERLLVDVLAWTNLAAETFDRAAGEVGDDRTRVQLVRLKLQAIRQTETLMQLLRQLGRSVPSEERTPPPPAPPRGGGETDGAAGRQALAHALTVAVHIAEGWRALDEIAAWAAAESVASALADATRMVGRNPDAQVEFLRQTLLRVTVAGVLV